MCNNTNKSMRGFTLIELLVVVSIIALLVSILMPSLGKAREQARRVVCSVHCHSMGQIIFIYAGDNNSKLPTTDAGSGWLFDVPFSVADPIRREYGMETLFCPANSLKKMSRDQLVEHYLAEMYDENGNKADEPDDATQGYVMSDYFWLMEFNNSFRQPLIYQDGTNHAGKKIFNRVLNVRQPSEYPLITDSMWTLDGPTIALEDKDFTNVSGGRFSSNHVKGRQALGNNTLNCDGSVQWVRFADMDVNFGADWGIYHYW